MHVILKRCTPFTGAHELLLQNACNMICLILTTPVLKAPVYKKKLWHGYGCAVNEPPKFGSLRT